LHFGHQLSPQLQLQLLFQKKTQLKLQIQLLFVIAITFLNYNFNLIEQLLPKPKTNFESYFEFKSIHFGIATIQNFRPNGKLKRFLIKKKKIWLF
jgi:hypothetical protein